MPRMIAIRKQIVLWGKDIHRNNIDTKLVIKEVERSREEFRIRADHDASKGISDLADGTEKLASKRLCLSEFEFNTGHRDGNKS